MSAADMALVPEDQAVSPFFVECAARSAAVGVTPPAALT